MRAPQIRCLAQGPAGPGRLRAVMTRGPVDAPRAERPTGSGQYQWHPLAKVWQSPGDGLDC